MLKNFISLVVKPPHTSQEVARHVQNLIQKNELDRALSYIQIFVDYVTSVPATTARILGTKQLDQLCQQIGEKTLKPLKAATTKNYDDMFVILASRLQKSGGHSRVIEDFFRLSPHKHKALVLTGTVGASDLDVMVPRLKAIGVDILQAHGKNHLQRLLWVQDTILTLKPECLYLFNHHQDSVAVAALQNGMSARAYYYHHADHHLALGVHHPYARHIDLSPYAYHSCQSCGIESHYLPLTIPAGQTKTTPFKTGKAMVTATAANRNKFDVPYFIQYSDVIPDMLQQTSGTHVHVGNLTTKTLTKIRNKLEKSQIEQSRFVYVPWTADIRQEFIKQDVDVYIASFPYGGGRTAVEVMSLGLPIAIHRNLASRLLGGIDMVPDEALIWRHPNELFAWLKSMTPENMNVMHDASLNHYRTYHPEENTVSALAKSHFVRPPQLKNLAVMRDKLQDALDICHHNRLAEWLNIVALRIFRFIRMTWYIRFCNRK